MNVSTVGHMEKKYEDTSWSMRCYAVKCSLEIKHNAANTKLTEGACSCSTW